MDLKYQRQPISRRLIGLAAVVVLHLFIFYALVSGLARDMVEVVKKPLEAKIIAAPPPPPPPVPLPAPPPPPPEPPPPEPPPPPPPEPPPPPPPKPPPPKPPPPPPYVPPPRIKPPPVPAPPPITVAPAPVPPKIEYRIEPPPPAPAPPPAPPAPPPAPLRQDIGVVCPKQVKPDVPRRALQDGTSGVVQAQLRIVDGVIQEVTILSGPRVFHSAVRNAMLQYKCATGAREVIATQEFEFRIE